MPRLLNGIVDHAPFNEGFRAARKYGSYSGMADIERLTCGWSQMLCGDILENLEKIGSDGSLNVEIPPNLATDSAAWRVVSFPSRQLERRIRHDERLLN